MRSWNHSTFVVLKVLMGVRNLPMRSWNNGWLIGKTNLASCSQFTNEELKQVHFQRGFRKIRWFAIYQWGVETKQNYFSQLHNHNVRNLPMRSWNRFFQLQVQELHHQFAIYQWGVETFFFFTETVNDYTVRNLPMRSWNANLFSCPCKWYSVRNLPMRSWNFFAIGWIWSP